MSRAQALGGVGLSAAVALGALVGCGPSAPPPAAPGGGEAAAPKETDAAMVTRLLGEIATAAECKGGAPSAACLATCWQKPPAADAAQLPKPPARLVGLSFVLPASAPADEVIDPAGGYVHLAALGLRADETQTFVLVAPLLPSTPEEQVLVKPAFDASLAHFAGKADAIVLPADLAEYLEDLPAAAKYPLARVEGAGWSWQGKSRGELRRACGAWLTVEIPEEGERGLIVSVFTDKVTP